MPESCSLFPMPDLGQKMLEDVSEVDFGFWKHCDVASLKIDR